MVSGTTADSHANTLFEDMKKREFDIKRALTFSIDAFEGIMNTDFHAKVMQSGENLITLSAAEILKIREEAK